MNPIVPVWALVLEFKRDCIHGENLMRFAAKCATLGEFEREIFVTNSIANFRKWKKLHQLEEGAVQQAHLGYPSHQTLSRNVRLQ